MDEEKILNQIQNEIKDALQPFQHVINNGQTRAAVKNSIMCVLMDNFARGNICTDPIDGPLVDINHEARLKHQREKLKSLEKQLEDAMENDDLKTAEEIYSKIFWIAQDIDRMNEEIQDPNRLNVSLLDPETFEPWMMKI